MRIDRQKIVRVFNEYVENYNRQDEKVRLKIEHTYRVSRLCEEIAASLGLCEEDISLAWFLGMLHDIGRFEQLKNYGTFIDAQSIDHAGYGADILFSQGKIRDFLEDHTEDELIKTAIACHNAYQLPEKISERTKMFCQILRDADKIDILKVNVEFSLEEIYNVTTRELYNCTVSGEVMEAFKEGHTVLRTLKKTTADHVVGHISLVYGLVYDKSLFLVKKQGYIYKLMDFKSDNPQTCRQFEQIREIMKRYLDAEMS
ncbi:MAG: HD domain-containing protein [Lachnospiraceae bacterium]|nr:HD domain-containing protein [Lachnospiraceae bacterium]